MSLPAGPYDFVYEHTDIPEGMTIREWRAQRAAERVAMNEAVRHERRRQRARRRRQWLDRFRAPVRRPAAPAVLRCMESGSG
jgi:hypothetical protein